MKFSVLYKNSLAIEWLIIIISFFLHSTRFSAHVTSDDALYVLMTYDYSFPEAIYTWGQNRIGSLGPLIGQIFYKLLNFNAAWAESLSRYLILILGYFSFRSILKTSHARIALCIIYFLPILYFIGFTKYSWGLLYSLLGILVWASLKAHMSTNKRSSILWSTLIYLLVFLSIWVMDQAIVAISLLTIYFLFFYPKRTKNTITKYIILGLAGLSIVSIILYLKSISILSNYHHYDKQWFNSLEELKLSLLAIYYSISFNLGFKSNINYSGLHLESIYFWGVLITVFYGLFQAYKRKKIEYILVILFCLLTCAMLFSSNWVHKNYEACRYFSGIHFVWLFYFFHLIDSKNKRKLSALVISILLLGSINTLSHNLSINNWKLESRYTQLKDLNSLGPAGFIGDFWHSYGIAFQNPSLQKASPHMYNEVKCKKCVDEVFNQKRIFIIRNQWLEEFPDEMMQFGRKLKKKGQAFQKADLYLNEYAIAE